MGPYVATDLLLHQAGFGEPSNEVALPHPQPRQQHDGKEHESGRASIIRKHLERAIDVADDGDRADDVNPADDRTQGGIFHEWWFRLSILTRDVFRLRS